MDLGIAHGTYTSNTNGTINGVNNGVIHGTANGVWNEANYIDPNAQAFIVAARITNMMQKSAINMLVKLLKSAGIWSKCNAIYPFVGGNQRSHSFNLINTAQYQLTFFGGWTHASTGATPNGTNGYADTGLVPSNTLTNFNAHLSFYSRTSAANANMVSIGSANSPTYTTSHQLILKWSDGFSYGSINNNSVLANGINPTSTGWYMTSRTANNSLKLYKNNLLLGINTTTITAIANTNKIFIGARNDGSPGALEFDNKECAFASIGSGLTDAEAAALNTIVQIYQTILNRNV